MCIAETNTLRNISAMKKWNELARDRMKETGVTQEKLAERLGVSQGGIGHWLSGRREPSLERINDVLSELGLPKLSVTADKSLVNVGPTDQPYRDETKYPLISWIQAGMWEESCDNFNPGDAEEWIESDANAGRCGYWLEVKGLSMYSQAGPSFPPTMRILVQPEGFDLVAGKFYIAKLLSTGETTFKQYVRDAGVGYLAPLNPTFKTIEITDEVEIIGRVIDGKLPKAVF